MKKYSELYRETRKALLPIDGPFIDVTVKITGKNSVTISNLPVGEYTITELTDWSWKYEQTDVHPTDGIVNAQQTTTNSVTFIDQYIDPTYWLHDESSKDNVFSH